MKRKIDIIALSILIAAAVNCGLIGAFKFDVITWLFDGQTVFASRIIYMLVAVSGLWCLNLIAVQAHRNHKTSYGAPSYMKSRNPEPDPMYNRYRTPDPLFKFEPGSAKDNPPGEAVCSPHFSKDCINEDAVSSATGE